MTIHRRRDPNGTTKEVLRALQHMFQTNAAQDTIFLFFEKTIATRVNVEREEIFTVIMDEDISAAEPEIAAGASRIGPSGAAEAAIHLCRTRFAGLVKERIQNLVDDLDEN